MHSLSQITIFWAESPALSLAACGRKTRHAPSAPRMAHGPHHGTFSVADDVADGVAHAVARKSLLECSLRAAGARPVRIPARAVALLFRKDATGFRALSLKPASLLRNAQASLPVPRSHRAPAGQGQKQHPRGGHRRKLAASARQRHFRRRPPALPRPTGGLFARVPSLMNQAASRSRYARSRKHRIGRVWGRSLRYRSLGLAIASAVTRSVSAGALPSPCFAWGLRITALWPWGLCKLSLCRVKVFCQLLRSLGRPARTFALGIAQTCLPCASATGCGRSPDQNLKPFLKLGSIVVQTSLNPQPNARPNLR